jgi:cystathionine beta-lyase/cystathionine gamma-synthase
MIRGLRTLPVRIKQITNSTHQVLSFLKNHSKVDAILFPLDESFPQYELAKQQMKGACGLFTFVLKTRKIEEIETVCNSLQHIMMAVSWGGHESLVIPKCSGLPSSEFDPNNIEHRYIRMYVGLEEPGYLIQDLEQALRKIS